jgi:hypothetical protein
MSEYSAYIDPPSKHIETHVQKIAERQITFSLADSLKTPHIYFADTGEGEFEFGLCDGDLGALHAMMRRRQESMAQIARIWRLESTSAAKMAMCRIRYAAVQQWILTSINYDDEHTDEQVDVDNTINVSTDDISGFATLVNTIIADENTADVRDVKAETARLKLERLKLKHVNTSCTTSVNTNKISGRDVLSTTKINAIADDVADTRVDNVADSSEEQSSEYEHILNSEIIPLLSDAYADSSCLYILRVADDIYKYGVSDRLGARLKEHCRVFKSLEVVNVYACADTDDSLQIEDALGMFATDNYERIYWRPPGAARAQTEIIRTDDINKYITFVESKIDPTNIY